jgi:hypothetical protein
MGNQTLSIILAVVLFLFIAVIGFATDILREQNTSLVKHSKYSFHRFQLWVWTLVICPIFSLHWGYGVEPATLINTTSLILLGISAGTMVTSAAITQAKVNDAEKTDLPKEELKATSEDSGGFFIDILTDDLGQISAGRLQNLVFTVVFVAMYISCFFAKATLHKYIDWDNDSTPFVLMGISSSAYLVGKGLKK